jgi:hypothetical protein
MVVHHHVSVYEELVDGQRPPGHRRQVGHFPRGVVVGENGRIGRKKHLAGMVPVLRIRALLHGKRYGIRHFHHLRDRKFGRRTLVLQNDRLLGRRRSVRDPLHFRHYSGMGRRNQRIPRLVVRPPFVFLWRAMDPLRPAPRLLYR